MLRQSRRRFLCVRTGPECSLIEMRGRMTELKGSPLPTWLLKNNRVQRKEKLLYPVFCCRNAVGEEIRRYCAVSLKKEEASSYY